MRDIFNVKLILCFVKYHSINVCIELSLKQTQCLQKESTHISADGKFVGWTVRYTNRGISNTVRDWDLRLRKKFKKHSSSSNGSVHDTNTQKTSTHQLPAMYKNCFLTPAVATEVYRQYTTECPLFPVATIWHVLLANSSTCFPYFCPESMAAKLSPEI